MFICLFGTHHRNIIYPKGGKPTDLCQLLRYFCGLRFCTVVFEVAFNALHGLALPLKNAQQLYLKYDVICQRTKANCWLVSSFTYGTNSDPAV